MKLKKALPVVLAEPENHVADTVTGKLYMLGQGTKRDPELSRFYAGKAPEQKRDMERDQAAGSAPRLGVKSTRSEPRTAEHKS